MEAVDATMSTPLHCASWKGHVKVVERLLAAGANPLAVTESGWTPLHSAAYRGHAQVAQRLLETGRLDPRQRDLMGYTPLELAEDLEVIKLLRDALLTATHDIGFDSAPEEQEPQASVSEEDALSGEPQARRSPAPRQRVDVNANLGLPADATDVEVPSLVPPLPPSPVLLSARTPLISWRSALGARLPARGS